MSDTLTTENFLDKYENERLLLIDARSEKEYDHAHIPGAINIPLLNNEHRHLVGIEYKSKGREAAVQLGFQLVGPLFHEIIEKANRLTDKKELMLYCWRGGMRSSIMAWILSMAGFKVSILRSGYKSFRSLVLSQFNSKKFFFVIGGHTGSGKTELLNELKRSGEQVIDLEALANHRGSAFGKLGLPPQPSNELFENMLGCILRKTDAVKTVWLEAESHSIGQVKINDDFFKQLREAPLIELNCSIEYRKKRVLKEYCVFPKNELAECTAKLNKRLGNLRMNEALTALENGNYNEWVEVLLQYYDKTYSHSLNERQSLVRVSLDVADNEKISDVAIRLLELTAGMKKELTT
jgi:tRNA 2-selenouridine synthase